MNILKVALLTKISNIEKVTSKCTGNIAIRRVSDREKKITCKYWTLWQLYWKTSKNSREMCCYKESVLLEMIALNHHNPNSNNANCSRKFMVNTAYAN